jgi:hypothetical protein
MGFVQNIPIQVSRERFLQKVCGLGDTHGSSEGSFLVAAVGKLRPKQSNQSTKEPTPAYS